MEEESDEDEKIEYKDNMSDLKNGLKVIVEDTDFTKTRIYAGCG